MAPLLKSIIALKRNSEANRHAIAFNTSILAIDSVDDMLALSFKDVEPAYASKVVAPEWVFNCAQRVRKTLFRPVDSAISKPESGAYRVGYGLGLIQWSMEGLRGLKAKGNAVPTNQRLPAGLRRRVNGRLKDLLIKYGVVDSLTTGGSKFIASLPRLMDRRSAKWKGSDAAEFYQGAADGVRGFGVEAPKDGSTTATPVHLQMLVMWRYVQQMDTLSEFHDWLVTTFGQDRAGSLERAKWICNAVGKKFSGRGRPRKNRPPLGLR